MNYRERVIRTVQFREVDELPFRHAYGLMPGVVEDWHQQGLPASVKTEKDICGYFSFPAQARPLPLRIDFEPPFDQKVIEDTREYRIATDWMGRTTKVIWSSSTLPVAIDYPVKDMETWYNYKRRLKFATQRVGSDLEQAVAENITAGHLNTVGTMGFYWFPRDLMGNEHLCISYYEQPELIEDVLETWCRLIEQVLTATLERVKIDQIHFGEDMAYKNSSMIGRPIFEKFIKPYYERIYNIVQKHSVPIFSVDSDGCLKELVHWFSECGVNFIGPNEVQAGNDVIGYRKQLGRKMSYDGGLDKLVLTRGRNAIDEMLDSTIPFMKENGGGWHVCLDHRVVKGTPLTDFQYYVSRMREMVRY
ncbi:MAG: uroporphyrinogen decarboxylase family protein [Planctomycetota bacterium]